MAYTRFTGLIHQPDSNGVAELARLVPSSRYRFAGTAGWGRSGSVELLTGPLQAPEGLMPLWLELVDTAALEACESHAGLDNCREIAGSSPVRGTNLLFRRYHETILDS